MGCQSHDHFFERNMLYAQSMASHILATAREAFAAAPGINAVTVLTVVLSALFGSPDEKQVTINSWANHDANGFVATAVQELDGTSGTATYGAPYNKTPDAAQKIGPVNLQDIGGVTVPVDTQKDFVLRPLSGITGDRELTSALATYRVASK